MKLKLPLLLLALLNTLASSVIHASETQYTMSQEDITPDFSVDLTSDTVYNLSGHVDFSEITSAAPFKVSATAFLSFQGDGSNNLTFSSASNVCLVKGGHVAFKKLNNLIFEGHSQTPLVWQATLLNLSSLVFENINSVSFRNIHTENFGGVIGGRQNQSGLFLFKTIGDITFDSNSSYYNGGVIYTYKGVSFENISGNIRFTNNFVTAEESINFGGAIDARGKIFFSNTGNILFEGNYLIGGQGGAINAFDGLDIINAGNVDFLNNETRENLDGEVNGGGAIASTGSTLLSADRGNITFRGNTRGLNEKRYADGLVMSFYGQKTLELRAQEGREIRFYDPIAYYSTTANKGTPDLDINKMPADLTLYGGIVPNFSGAIRFSGEAVGGFLHQAVGESAEDYAMRLHDSRYSNINTTINLHNGAIVIEHGATVGCRPDSMPSLPPSLDGSINVEIATHGWGDVGDREVELSAKAPRLDAPLTWESKYGESGFHLLQGTLEMRNKGVLSVKTASFSGQNAVIRADGKALLIADAVDMSKGFSFDFMPFLDDNKSGLVIMANSLTLGGTLGVADTSIDHYSDNRWADGHRLMVLNLNDVSSVSGSLGGITSNASGSAEINSPYARQGTWSYEWVGNELFAIWTPKTGGGITDVQPELEGNLIANSMWSSASNAKSLSNTALANANILRMESSLQNNFWVKGLGDFAYDDSSAQLDGYSYHGGGYAAGVDFKLGSQSIVGVAFGQLMGDNKSELYNAKIKQESMMGSIYAAHLQTLNKKNSLLWTLAGTYGDTENSMKTHYRDGQNSTGSWNNNAYLVDAKLEWRIASEGKSWTYKPFIGLEYTDVNLESFTESGDKVRSFAEGKYKNLALPIGAGVEHQSQFGSKTWLNSLSLAYVPDVYREAPSTQATRLSSGFSWKDQGSKPSIHTLRAGINSTLQLNTVWTVYAGYTFEAREGSSYHDVNTGVSYSF